MEMESEGSLRRSQEPVMHHVQGLVVHFCNFLVNFYLEALLARAQT
jgi:hypothetical protein